MSKEERQAKTEGLLLEEAKKANTEAVAVTYEKNGNRAKGSVIDGWYTDIGKKIKDWAKRIFIIEAIAFVIGAVTMMFSAEDGWMIIVALIALVAGPVLALVSSWILYAFGELVEKTSANEKNTRNILELMLENNTKDDGE